VLRRALLLALVVATVAALAAPVTATAATASTRAASRPDPVLLVHGFRGSSHGWHALESTLEAHGYRRSEIDAIDYGHDASNLDVARQIGRAADALRARTGAARIDVVSHSMGAISSRYWLERLGGAAHVDAWVSLAGVNEGTIWAYGCYVLAPCREMVPTSSLLEGLNHDFRAVGPTRFGAWWSPCDDAVVPRGNAELPGAHNVETGCLGHSEVRSDPRVLGQVVHFLGERLRPVDHA
jgi:pimeloyl-ACP methyl ester carboxylesterase